VAAEGRRAEEPFVSNRLSDVRAIGIAGVACCEQRRGGGPDARDHVPTYDDVTLLALRVDDSMEQPLRV